MRNPDVVSVGREVYVGWSSGEEQVTPAPAACTCAEFVDQGKLDAMGGMVKAIERGYPQKEIAEASYQYQRAVEAREKVIVGANEFVIEEESPRILYIDESVGRQQSAKLKSLRERRSNEEVRRTLDDLKKAAAQEPKAGTDGNVSAANRTMITHSSVVSCRDVRYSLNLWLAIS